MVATIENQFLRLSVKGSGAEMVSVKDTASDIEYLWQGDPKFWPRRAPVLFPIVGKLNENKFQIDGQEFLLPQHGFARNQMFDVVAGTERSLLFLLKANKETLSYYPYNFELYVGYELNDRKITVSYEVKNVDSKSLYFSIGGHPGFNVAVFPNENFSDYYLEFSEKETLDRHLLEDGLFNGKQEKVLDNTNVLNLSHSLFNKDAVVLKGGKSNSVSLKSKKSSYNLRFTFPGFPYLGIWSPKGDPNFVCLEPWFGLADKLGYTGTFKEKEGVQSLEAGKSFKCAFSFEILS